MLVRENILQEGIYYNDTNFIFDFINDNKNHFINLKFGNKFVKVNNKNIFYSYRFKDNTDPTIKKIFLRALKYKNETLILSNDYDKFLNKAVMGFFHNMSKDIDIIIYPKSSSPLNFDIAKRIKDKLGYNTIIANDIIVKNNIENIKIDTSKISVKTAEKLLKIIVNREDFQLKHIPPKFRHYFSNFLKFDDNVQHTYYNKLRNNVLIVDDILTKGTTMRECELLARSLNPNFLLKYVLIKS